MTSSPPPPGSTTLAPAGIGRQGLCTMAGAAVLLGLLLFGMAQEQIWVLFSKPVEFKTKNANGLSAGLPVRLSGFPIGRVDRVELRPDATVLVTLKIQPTYRTMLGPHSRIRLDQDGLVGSSYLDVTPDSSGSSEQASPLVVHYEDPVDLKELLVDLAQSRIPLNRLLDRTATLAESSLPRTLTGMDRTIKSAGDLSRSLQQQSELTATQARLTLETYQALGRDGRHSLSASQKDLETLLPLLRETLKDVRTTAQASERLLDRLSGSWLMPLLDGSTAPGTKPAGSAKP